MVDLALVSCKYLFLGSFGQILKFVLFRPIFWPIFPYKIPKSKTYGAIAQIKSLKSSNGCFGLLIHKGTGCEVGRAQKNIFGFSGHPKLQCSRKSRDQREWVFEVREVKSEKEKLSLLFEKCKVKTKCFHSFLRSEK